MKETDLCNILIEEAMKNGWTIYPETGDWDILLMRAEIQIGVQAKLTGNIKVLHQALPKRFQMPRKGASDPERLDCPGPDFRTVLIPRKRTLSDFVEVAQHLRLWTFSERGFGMGLLKTPLKFQDLMWKHREPVWTPQIALDVAAGASSPLANTPWKENVLRLLARAKLRGHVTSADAQEIGLSFQTITKYMGWLVRVMPNEGRFQRWVLNDAANRPDLEWADAFEYYLTEQADILNITEEADENTCDEPFQLI